MAKTSFSAAARVARPKRVQRKSAASASAISTTTPAIQNRFAGIDASNTRMMLVGKTFGICFDAEPNHSSTVAWRMRRIPSDATSFASGDDVRSGRKTSSSLSTPTRIAASNVRAIAGAVANVKPNSSVRKAQNAYAATIETAPVARLMIPEPR
jgi:hypothetical protein